MRLEPVEHRPLEDDEIIMKQKYNSSDRVYWSKPMTFAQYQEYSELDLLAQTPVSYLFKERSLNKLGVTVNDVNTTFQVNITVHRRYSYPVLHNHQYIEIIYVAAGCCENFFENASITMSAGDVCVMATNAFHAISCTNDESCILNIMVSPKFFDQNFLSLLGGNLISQYLEKILYQRTSSPYILFPTGNDSWLLELGRRMITENKRMLHGYDYSIRLLASEFLIHISREYEVHAIVPNQNSATKNTLIVAVLGYLSVNYNRTTLAETARFFGYSQSYLSRTIREQVGKTYNTIIGELQMQHALELLDKKEMNLTEIAQEVGCFDSSHFNKKFKAIYNMTPREYLAR